MEHARMVRIIPVEPFNSLQLSSPDLEVPIAPLHLTLLSVLSIPECLLVLGAEFIRVGHLPIQRLVSYGNMT